MVCHHHRLSSSKPIPKDFLFGMSACYAALMSGERKIFKLILNEKLQGEPALRPQLLETINEAKKREVPISYKSDVILGKLSNGNRHQNIVAEVGSLVPKELGNIPLRREGVLWLVLHHIKDPMNLGGILRTCAYLGVDRVVLNLKDCAPLTPKVSKASSGAMEWVPIYGVNDIIKFLRSYRKAGWNVIGGTDIHDPCMINNDIETGGLDTTAPTSDKPYKTFENVGLDDQNILLIGDDDLMMDDELKSHCSQLLTLPSSKNELERGLFSPTCSVGAGIMLHNLLKKKDHMMEQTKRLDTCTDFVQNVNQ